MTSAIWDRYQVLGLSPVIIFMLVMNHQASELTNNTSLADVTVMHLHRTGCEDAGNKTQGCELGPVFTSSKCGRIIAWFKVSPHWWRFTWAGDGSSWYFPIRSFWRDLDPPPVKHCVMWAGSSCHISCFPVIGHLHGVILWLEMARWKPTYCLSCHAHFLLPPWLSPTGNTQLPGF